MEESETLSQSNFYIPTGLMALDDISEYPDRQDEGYIQLHQLYLSLKQAAEETYER